MLLLLTATACTDPPSPGTGADTAPGDSAPVDPGDTDSGSAPAECPWDLAPAESTDAADLEVAGRVEALWWHLYRPAELVVGSVDDVRTSAMWVLAEDEDGLHATATGESWWGTFTTSDDHPPWSAEFQCFGHWDDLEATIYARSGLFTGVASAEAGGAELRVDLEGVMALYDGYSAFGPHTWRLGGWNATFDAQTEATHTVGDLDWTGIGSVAVDVVQGGRGEGGTLVGAQTVTVTVAADDPLCYDWASSGGGAGRFCSAVD